MGKQATVISANPTLTPSRFSVVQRKRACGCSTGMSCEREECQEKQLTMNRYSTDRQASADLSPSLSELARSTTLPYTGAATRSVAAHNFGWLRVGGTMAERAVSRPGDRSEDEADRAAEHVMRALSSPVFEEKQEAPALSQTPPLIQRAVVDETAAETGAAPETTMEPETAAPEETPVRGLIVEDEAGEIGPGQMRKSEFLDELRAAVCMGADAELAAAGRSTEGCPYIERAFERYRAMSGAQLERRLRRYAPEAAGATSAREYIPAVSERVRRAVAVWATTGKITGVPEELASELPGAGLLGAFGGLLSGIGGAVSALAGGIGRIFFKAKDGSAKDADPREVRAQLGSGSSLDGGVRSRMESAFGHDFSRVRVHTDAKAARVSAGLNARAFTIGSDIAFGMGEYRPSTLIGDALIAHELAHVVQQAGATNAALSPSAKGAEAHSELEEEADASAVNAVASLWGEAMLGVDRVARQAAPRLKAGLKLQRCGGGPEAKPKTTYEQYLFEGTQKLKGIAFGLQWGDWCTQKPTRGGESIDGFDTEYWVKQEDPQAGCKLVLKQPHTPAQAITALFDPSRKDLWQVDCGQFVQLAHYYAMLKVHGPDKFNKLIGPNMEFKKLGSTGLKRKALWGRRAKDELMQLHEFPPGGGEPTPVQGVKGRREQEVLDDAPFGSRVEFTNGFISKIPTAVNPSYTHENTMKVGDDAFVAHPFTKGISNRNVFTKEELIDLINEGTEPEYRKAARGEIYISEIEFYDLP